MEKVEKKKKATKAEKSVTVVEDYGGQKTAQEEFNVDTPLKQMVVDEVEEVVQQHQ